MNPLSRYHAAALTYMQYQWSVFPLEPCGKRPFPSFPVRTFQRERRANERDIDRWWHGVPDANVAIATGQISNLFVVDCDTTEAYHDVLKRGVHVTTLTAKTGNGYHLYFEYPEFSLGNRAKIMPGVDVRGDGGYAVAPPSIHPSGARYTWHNRAPIVRAPFWLLKMLKPEPVAFSPLPKGTPQQSSGFASVALNRELNNLIHAPDGQRNNQLNRSAFCLGQLVGGGELTDADVITGLWNAALSIGLSQQETMPTILSGLNAGKRYPRTRYRRTVAS